MSLLALAGLGFLGGCNLLGAAAVVGYKVAGPPKVDPKYTPARSPMLVMVDDSADQSGAEVPSDWLARVLAQQIQVHDVAPVINPDQLQALKDAKPTTYPTMPITEVAHAVGAAQVLYVRLQHADVSPLSGGDGYTGSAGVTVRIVDAASGKTLWPMNEGQYPVAARTEIRSAQGAPDPRELRKRLYDSLADQIARLFYPWQPEDMSPQNYQQ